MDSMRSLKGAAAVRMLSSRLREEDCLIEAMRSFGK